MFKNIIKLIKCHHLKLFYRKFAESKLTSEKMAAAVAMKRYIDNPFQDFQEGEPIEIDTVYVISLIRYYVEMILGNTSPNDNGRGDLYVGNAGIAYMFWKMNRSPQVSSMYPALEYAQRYIRSAKGAARLFKRIPGERCSFLLGNAGIYAVGAAIAFDAGNTSALNEDMKSFLHGFDVCRNMRQEGDEILVGRAGYLSGCYWLNKYLPFKPISDDLILEICNVLVDRGRQYAIQFNSVSPLMYQYHGTEYLGAAHGISGILHMLIGSPWFKNMEISRSKYNDIRASIDYYVSLQDRQGNFPSTTDSSMDLSKPNILVHWCHGAPGAIPFLIKCYLVFKENAYLRAAKAAAELVWKKGLLLKGPGICHGVAGNGYQFLLLYQVTQQRKYLFRAVKFMEFLTHDEFWLRARVPDNPYSLFEGFAGTVCFLVDLLKPDSAEFPFMDGFDQ